MIDPFTLIKSRITAVLHPTLPFLELPQSVFRQVADKLRLEYDDDNDLFLITEATRNYLNLSEPILRVEIGTRSRKYTVRGTVTPTLPFAAFNHHMKLGNETILYFPMKVADDEERVILGRTLFQEM